MRYREFMAEAIPNRPRNQKMYLTLRIKELGQMLAALETANGLIKSNDNREGLDLIRYALRYAFEDREDPGIEAYDAAYTLNDFDLNRQYDIERLHQNLESYLQYGNLPGYDFMKYVMATLADVEKEQERPAIQEYIAKFQLASKMLPFIEEGFAKYGFDPNNPADQAEPEYVAAKKLVVAYRVKVRIFDRIVPLQADLRSKLGVIQRMRNHDAMLLSPHKYHPEHGEIETLYHASAFIPEILRDGFSVEKPTERIGIGNFGQQQTISFTHDLEIARNIMRAFKELWMIAHGKLTGSQIIGWARAEGIEDGIKKSWGGIEGGPLPINRNSNPHEVAKLYRYWLSYSKLRSDPMLTYPWEIADMLKNRKLSDIGVLSCEVRLEQTDEYMVGESEFRLTADRVLPGTIKRLL